MDHAKQTAILEANSLPIRRVYPVELEFAGEPIPPHTAKRTALGRRHHNGAAGQRRQACRYDFDPHQWISVDLNRPPVVSVLRRACLRFRTGYGMPATSRSEEHTSELQSLMRISYAVFCLKKKKKRRYTNKQNT